MFSFGYRVLLGLLDRVEQRRVARRVAAAGARGHLDVLDQLGEQLPAPGIDDGLLVLGGCPLGVAAHACSFTMFDKELVQPQVRRQLRMERRSQQCPLADRDDPTRARVGAEYLDIRAGLLYPRRPDEYSAQRGAGHSLQLDVTFERVHLTAERVPPHRHIDSAERLLPVDPVDQPVRQHDHPGTAAERGQAGLYPLAHRLHQVERHGQLPDRGGLAARDDQAVDLVELLWPADLHRRGARGGQRAQVLGDVTLQREHADERPSASARRSRIAVPRHQPRPA